MGLFSRSKPRYLGVDIGSSAIKIVEFENEEGKPKLVTYGYIEQGNEVLKTDSLEAKEKIVEGIKRIYEEAHFTTRNAVAALPSYTVFTSVIHLPQMKKKELEAAVKWEAKKFVPMPLEEMILDWKILEKTAALSKFNPQKEKKSKESSAVLTETMQGLESEATIHTPQQNFLKILLTAAPKNLVSRFVEIFHEAKLNLLSLETESFALERSLIGRDSSPILLIDIGATATTISVVIESIPLINRSIDVGGVSITKAIASSLNIDFNRAEQFKRDFGLRQQSGVGGQIPKRIEFMISSIINEIKYVLKLYQSQGVDVIEKIVLAGGSAWLPNLAPHLSSVLGVQVIIGDPWARVMYPVDVEAVLKNLGPRFAVAVGLGMREIK